ncbi:ABC-2 type transporter-domain-containing protein [Filobasidium floriforme]|uniref:ABC-2 type transporter-domain-containing protein n=1 Tax=Filobasidium floriforme TaxID=5210 RepID=UPI001E8CFCA2|nr:ABC-2 type transporter-domain-containing protein [Filobasidium floriforme]KAH8080244.1 ABC-2 type transporter-domain-containing protein [Filobasidium floriforme]
MGWARRIMDIYRRDAENNPLRSVGVSFKNLSVFGYGSDSEYQPTVANIVLSLASQVRQLVSSNKRKVSILNNFDGLLEAGEMLVVLGPPGSGCSTFLKTLAGEMNGIYRSEESMLNYQGITPEIMHQAYRGEAIYCAEVESNFATLTVGDTLQFAAESRCPKNPPGGVSRKEFALHMRNVVMALLGIIHTVNTKVGSDVVRGVSGGERKRVSIAEVLLADSPLQCWDNSTRGLDSATAVEFCNTLRMSSDLANVTAVVAIYQAPQSAYDMFDKVSVLYESEQIFFGRTNEAKRYFEKMGYECKPGQSTPDFLTSLTNASERITRAGFEGKVPKNPSEFVRYWKQSSEYSQLLSDIDAYNARHPIGGGTSDAFSTSRRAQQADGKRRNSPYTLTYTQQVKLCLRRSFWRIAAEPAQPVFELSANVVMSLAFSSVFYNLSDDTASFQQRAGVIFLAMLLAAFASALEIMVLYEQRPIVEKHARYAFIHPSAEAWASLISSLPYKVVNATLTSLVYYFMANLNRQPGNFFFFLFLAFLLTMAMSLFFRAVSALSRSMIQAMVPAGLLIVAMITFSGFVIPYDDMRGWSKWIIWLDPFYYAFEALLINEFSGRYFPCSDIVPSGPGYPDSTSEFATCSTQGSVPGRPLVFGDDFIRVTYNYQTGNKWRNVGILFAFNFGLLVIYMIAAELVTAKKSKGEVLVWPRSRSKDAMDTRNGDIEHASKEMPVRADDLTNHRSDALASLPKQAVFSWSNICYDIKIKGNERRILDHVDGWVKPGQLTALMGVSGAGKTTLLDLLATRITMGVVTGETLVDGRPIDASFQRKTGYVQQQDLHLPSSTVREALAFSALLRQPASVSCEAKLAHVEEVLELLEMSAYADAVVGVPGEGLNVEQRKRLTIGVELAAKPDLLLFLDEPTSGLDSQTSWSICSLLVKLSQSGQAILCTIHQPSAQLFERFDRLLFLAKGGRTVYFGEVGKGSRTLVDYFVRNGAKPCPEDANPAEWMLQAIGAAPGHKTDVDWPRVWQDSEEKREVKRELEVMRSVPLKEVVSGQSVEDDASRGEFASTYRTQFIEVTKRVAQFYWRNPTYIYSKLILVIGTGLFIGLCFFKTETTSRQELLNKILSIFVLYSIFGQIVEQILPEFVSQRALYEVRERPSKTYAWPVFLAANILIESVFNLITAIPLFIVWYYPVGLNENGSASGTTHERGGLMLLFIVQFMVFSGTFGYLMIAAVDLPEIAGAIMNLLFVMSLVFCGVLAPPSTLPGFWKFMYRVSPFTYLAEGMLVTGLSQVSVTCSDREIVRITAPPGQTCVGYLADYISTAGGYLVSSSTSPSEECLFCPLSTSDDFLSTYGMSYTNRWRDFGIVFAYIGFNIVATFALYKWFRVFRLVS